MILITVAILFIASIYLMLYQFRVKIFGTDETHLPGHMFEGNNIETGLLRDKYSKQPGNVWLSVSNKLGDLEKHIPLPTAGLKRKLIKAGSVMNVAEFFGFKLLSLIFIPVISFLALGNRFPRETVFAVSLLMGFFIPEFWLIKKIKARQGRMRKDLPNIIDLLNLCVSGGIDFMLAVNRVVKDLKPCELTRELSEVYHETQMGKARREALKNFAWRVDMPEVHSFVRTLVQADRMGTPLAEALNMQAEEIRIRRFQSGEAMALKAPIKLLFPLFAFILPVVLIIVGGPIIMQFLHSGTQFGF